MNATTTKATRTIENAPITRNAYKHFGVTHAAEIVEGHFATIVLNKSITLHGTVTNSYDKVKAKLTKEVFRRSTKERFTLCTAHADCRANDHIALKCAQENDGKPMPFSRTFEIGDDVEFDSYNLSYTGTIVAIGAKTVSVETGRGNHDANGVRKPSIRRMDLASFDSRNWDLDLAAIAKRNSEWSD